MVTEGSLHSIGVWPFAHGSGWVTAGDPHAGSRFLLDHPPPPICADLEGSDCKA